METWQLSDICQKFKSSKNHKHVNFLGMFSIKSLRKQMEIPFPNEREKVISKTTKKEIEYTFSQQQENI